MSRASIRPLRAWFNRGSELSNGLLGDGHCAGLAFPGLQGTQQRLMTVHRGVSKPGKSSIIQIARVPRSLGRSGRRSRQCPACEPVCRDSEGTSMKAQIRTRLVEPSKRRDLNEIAPLGVPFVVMVDPASTCNFKCKFCPTGHPELIKSTGRYQGAMKFEVFTKLIDDLQAFPRAIKVLRLYKEGEPLMNKRFADMVAYARRSDRIERIDTTTNGALLTPKTSEKIIAAGINQINISVNGVRDEQFMDLVKAKVSFEKYVENIKYLYNIRGDCEIYVKAIHENLSEDDRKRFLDIFGDMADRIFFEHLFRNWPEFETDFFPDQFHVGQYGDPPLERLVCPYIFYSMTVNSDGSVSLCVQDWARKLVVGSVQDQTMEEIWFGKALNNHRMAHLSGCRKDNSTCAKCECMSFGVHDNIDKQASQIKERLTMRQYS
jgi:radical SAM protein with 4Fe4S-binding SPASM domain